MNPCGVVVIIKLVWHLGGDGVRDCILVGSRTALQHRKNGLLRRQDYGRASSDPGSPPDVVALTESKQDALGISFDPRDTRKARDKSWWDSSTVSCEFPELLANIDRA
jgi:hypothetical protein